MPFENAVATRIRLMGERADYQTEYELYSRAWCAAENPIRAGFLRARLDKFEQRLAELDQAISCLNDQISACQDYC